MDEGKKLVVAYLVKRYENGDINVEDAKLDGTTEVDSNFIYKDIEEVARAVKTKKIENAAYAGVMRFYQEMQAAEEAKAREAEEGK